MHTLSKHYSPALKAEFTAAATTLRLQIGLKPFEMRDRIYGVGGETFRAFRNCPVPPSQVFRDWAGRICEKLKGHKLREHLRSREAFLKWHALLALGLQAQWDKQQKCKLSFAHKFKLVDLFVKWLSDYNHGSPNITTGFIEHSNCALDRQILNKLNECLSGALPISSPSMGDITNRHTYDFCQELIAEFSKACGATPLLFDYYAWKPGG